MIFVSIASYRDPDVLNTIDSLIENADNPLNIFVFNQSEDVIDHPNATIINIDYKKAKGPSWARHVLQSFITDEKYYMQIDAHMRVCKGWDTKMIQYLGMANSQKALLSYYPPPSNNRLEPYVQRNVVRGVGSGAVSSIGEILNSHVGLPIVSHTMAAGFIFAPIEFAFEVPIDPQIYWNYEETDLTLRAYTNGWDFFASPEPIIWHRYNTTGVVNHHDTWVGLENFSNDHARKKYLDPNYQTRYKLGNARTLESFEALNNLSLEHRWHENRKKELLIVVPYRDRDEHLKVYLEKVPQFFKGISHDILLCELDPGCEWNAGLTVNSMINFRGQYDYIYISHVDVYPTDGWEWPEEGQFIADMGDAGSCLMRYQDFLNVGGYSNNFWGWGAEDDHLYMKLHSKGLIRKKATTGFNTDFQNHPRVFKGKNYTHNLRELARPFDYMSIWSVNRVSITHSLKKIGDNIYKQNVTSTFVLPVNKRAVLGYIKGVTDFKIVAPWVKSAMYYGNNYDVIMFCVDCTIQDQLEAFGVKVINRTMVIPDLFFDRWLAYKSVDYDYLLHLDVTDAYFQANPFTEDDLVVGSEGVLIKDCSWNTNMLQSIYGYSFPDKEVLCGGYVAGKKEKFHDLCDKLLIQYYAMTNKMYGADQPALNKLVYTGQVEAKIVNTAAHLHHHFTGLNPIEIDGIRVPGYDIVHQFNRDQTLYNRVLDFYEKFFSIDQIR